MWDLNHKESWVPQNWCFWIIIPEKSLESPLDWKEIKTVNLKGNQSWIFIGRTEAEAPILWPPDANSRLSGKYPDAGNDWGHGEKGVTQVKMVGWHHQLSGHEFEKTLGDSEGQGILECFGYWLQSMQSQTVGHNWVTEQQQIHVWHLWPCGLSPARLL